jgi:hypothetical protein
MAEVSNKKDEELPKTTQNKEQLLNTENLSEST